MLGLMLGELGWLALAGLLLYARSRGWTAGWERDHRTVSFVVGVVVMAGAAGALVVLGVLGLVGITIAGPSVPWVLRRALEATAIGATAFAVGRFDAFVVAARARIGQSQPPRILAPVVTAVTVLQVLLHGASGLPLAAAFLGVALVGFAIGARWHRPPEAAPGH